MKKNKIKSLEYGELLWEIQQIYTDNDNLPMDSDEIDCLIEILRNQLNEINGNI